MNKKDNEKNNNQRHRLISKRPMSFYINYCFFILGLEIREAIYPKNTAALPVGDHEGLQAVHDGMQRSYTLGLRHEARVGHHH